MPDPGSSRREQALWRCEQEYRALKAQVQDLGYILQGSLRERWMQCGKQACRCATDTQARHGPYYQWSWAEHGKTKSVYLDAEQAALCRKWIGNHRQLERLLKRMRAVSLRAARLHEIHRKGVRKKRGK